MPIAKNDGGGNMIIYLIGFLVLGICLVVYQDQILLNSVNARLDGTEAAAASSLVFLEKRLVAVEQHIIALEKARV
jgi:biotin transporter BioY